MGKRHPVASSRNVYRHNKALPQGQLDDKTTVALDARHRDHRNQN